MWCLTDPSSRSKRLVIKWGPSIFLQQTGRHHFDPARNCHVVVSHLHSSRNHGLYLIAHHWHRPVLSASVQNLWWYWFVRFYFSCFSLYAITALGLAPPAEVPTLRISIIACSSSFWRFVTNVSFWKHPFCNIHQTFYFYRKRSFTFLQCYGFKLQRAHSSCANETKQFNRVHAIRRATLTGKPQIDQIISVSVGKSICQQSQQFEQISNSPSPFFLSDGNSNLFFPEWIGICNGAKSQFRFLNLESYSKAASPVVSFHATAPTNSPHILHMLYS